MNKQSKVMCKEERPKGTRQEKEKRKDGSEHSDKKKSQTEGWKIQLRSNNS